MSIVEYFLGGAKDKGDWAARNFGSTNIMDIVAANRRLSAKEVTCLYRGHEDEATILSEIEKKWKSFEYSSIRLTGHSWGGQAVMNIAQELFNLSIPVDELITLDPVAAFPFGKVTVARWVNVYIDQSLLDKTVGNVPILGNVAMLVLTSPTLLSRSGREGGFVANIGGQLGEENGAHNIKMNVSHADAQTMYDKARSELHNAPMNPKAIGRR